MAIDNVQAVRFANERIRVAANRFAQLYNWCTAIKNEWAAQGLGPSFPDDAGETVVDGSATDGRPIITGEDVNNIKDLVLEFLANFEANSNTKLHEILRVAPHPDRE